LTFITLLIHRIRAARAAQRDRAPEDIVRNLPWLVWTGTGWEKHEGTELIPEIAPPSSEADLEEGVVRHESSPRQRSDGAPNNPSTSCPYSDPNLRPWFEAQVECAICLSDFVKGDKVRVLPCQHIFHLSEVDEWLIHRKKLVSFLVSACIRVHLLSTPFTVSCLQSRRYAASPSIRTSRINRTDRDAC
jgi:hypothetical protein